MFQFTVVLHHLFLTVLCMNVYNQQVCNFFVNYKKNLVEREEKKIETNVFKKEKWNLEKKIFPIATN